MARSNVVPELDIKRLTTGWQRDYRAGDVQPLQPIADRRFHLVKVPLHRALRAQGVVDLRSTCQVLLGR